MTMKEYTIKMMSEHPENWHSEVNENGVPIIVNKDGNICDGVQEVDGNIITAAELIEGFNSLKDDKEES